MPRLSAAHTQKIQVAVFTQEGAARWRSNLWNWKDRETTKFWYASSPQAYAERISTYATNGTRKPSRWF